MCAFGFRDRNDLPVELDLRLGRVGVGRIDPVPTPMKRIMHGDSGFDCRLLIEGRDPEGRLVVQDLQILLGRRPRMHQDFAQDRRRDDDLLFVGTQGLDQIFNPLCRLCDRFTCCGV